MRRIRTLERQFAGRDPAIAQALRGVHADPRWGALRALVPQQPELRAFWQRARQASPG